MGKDLKGKECGKGICQRKDGLYYARFTNHDGKSVGDYFEKLTEAKKWLTNSKYNDNKKQEQPTIAESQYSVDESTMTVDQWFQYWIDNIVCDLAPNTRRNYRERYLKNIQPVIGAMPLQSVKPMHCKAVLNKMNADYAGSTIRQAYIAMGTMLKAAKMNDMIHRHPMDGVRYTKPVKASDDIRFLTKEEQAAFLKVAKKSHNYYQYALILETGLRTGELIGLTWDAIDLENRTLTVNKTMEFRYKSQEWRAGPPKTQSSYRTIPLTSNAVAILTELKNQKATRKESKLLNTNLSFVDRRTGKTRSFCMRDLVFINFRTGEPIKNSSYDTHLYKLCEKAGIEPFSMHALRHTYATRMIERGVRPKDLQSLLGHASIKTTMDRYVHVTGESLTEAVQRFESYDTEIANCVE